MTYQCIGSNSQQKILSARDSARCGSKVTSDGNQSSITAIPISTAYHYNIHGAVGGIEEYSDLLDLLQYVGENDVVYLHLNTPGGYLDTTVDLVHRIKACQATVVGCADGMVASAGSILFFACHGWEVGEFAQFMLHDGSDGHVGKTNENVISAKASASRLSSLYQQVYGPFFKPSEIKKVLGGQDKYMTCDEVIKRLEVAVDNATSDA